MKRRDLIKTGLLGLGAATLSGCNKEEISQNDELKIIPKQTGIYEFSAPMPFNYKTIDEIAELNKTLTKSKVTSFYNNAPNWNHKNLVSIGRAKNDFIKTYDDFFKYVDYVHDKGFEISYLMNSPKPFSENDFNSFRDELNKLLDKLAEHNVKNIKIANMQVAKYINDTYEDKFNIHASTAFEFGSVSQYEYLNELIKNITLIDISNNENQNFKFLNSLKNKFPKTKLELMVNETCLKNCPGRLSCVVEDRAVCTLLMENRGIMADVLRVGIIYPWNLEYYSALGINNFKFISSAGMENGRGNYHNIGSLKAYLNCIENGTDNILVFDFFTKIYDKYKFHYPFSNPKSHAKNMTLSDIKPLFPDIRYFIAHGHECSYRCGVDCNYCFECAKKLEKVLLYS